MLQCWITIRERSRHREGEWGSGTREGRRTLSLKERKRSWKRIRKRVKLKTARKTSFGISVRKTPKAVARMNLGRRREHSYVNRFHPQISMDCSLVKADPHHSSSYLSAGIYNVQIFYTILRPSPTTTRSDQNKCRWGILCKTLAKFPRHHQSRPIKSGPAQGVHTPLNKREIKRTTQKTSSPALSSKKL